MHVTTTDVQAWADKSKIVVDEGYLDQPENAALLTHIESEILGRLAGTVDVTGWTDATTTPQLVRTAISKSFVATIWRRQYSENTTGFGSNYAGWLDQNAESIIQGILDGTLDVGQTVANAGSPSFYPTDASSALCPTLDDSSLGPAKFSMGQIF